MSAMLGVAKMLVYMVTTARFIYFNCWATFDQYAATSSEESFGNRWNSITVIRQIIYASVLVAMLILISSFFFNGVLNTVCKVISLGFRTYNRYTVYFLFYELFPFGVIRYYTFTTIQNLHPRTVISQQTSQRFARQTRSMVLLQLAALAISILPFNIEGAYTTATISREKDECTGISERLVFRIVRLFFFFNYVSTFYSRRQKFPAS